MESQMEGRRILKVSEISRSIAQTLEGAFPSLWLKGELSNFKAHSSGHWYFSLKDELAQIRGVMFRGSNQRIRFLPENGMEVLVQGRISVYPPQGSYQIVCQEMEPAGAGALQKRFEELKQKLKAEGLFDEGRKKAHPLLPAENRRYNLSHKRGSSGYSSGFAAAVSGGGGFAHPFARSGGGGAGPACFRPEKSRADFRHRHADHRAGRRLNGGSVGF